MCLATKNQNVQKHIAVMTILATITPASGAVLKFMAQRSLAAAGVETDPHCSTGIVSLPFGDKNQRSCCAGYCGACNDFDTCSSIRGQASQYACCALKVYSRRCGNAPANVCLKTCSESTPPCIMDVDIDAMKMPVVKKVKGVSDCGDVVPHARSMHANAVEKGETLTDIHKTMTQLNEAVHVAKKALAKAETTLADPDIPADFKTKVEEEAKHAQQIIDFVDKHREKTQQTEEAVSAAKSWEEIPKKVELMIKEASLLAKKDNEEAQNSLGKEIGLTQAAYIAVARLVQKEAAAAAAEAEKKRLAAEKAKKAAEEALKKAAEEKAAEEAAEEAARLKKEAEEKEAAAKSAKEEADRLKALEEEKARLAGLAPKWSNHGETWEEEQKGTVSSYGEPKAVVPTHYWNRKTLENRCGDLLGQKSFSLSVRATLKAHSYGTEAYMFETKDHSMQFGIHENSQDGGCVKQGVGCSRVIYFRMKNGCAANVQDITLFHEEHHLVGTYDAETKTQRIFVDGELRTECSHVEPLECPSSDDNVYIGCHSASVTDTGCSWHMTGSLRDMKIFSGRALPEDEIKSEFDAGKASLL